MVSRPVLVPHEIGGLASKCPLGILVAAITEWDSQSPVMLAVYDDFADALEVPLYTLYPEEASEHERHTLRLFSTPTLLWVRGGESQVYDKSLLVTTIGPHSFEILMRQVGTVMMQKLIREAEQVLEVIQ